MLGRLIAADVPRTAYDRDFDRNGPRGAKPPSGVEYDRPNHNMEHGTGRCGNSPERAGRAATADGQREGVSGCDADRRA